MIAVRGSKKPCFRGKFCYSCGNEWEGRCKRYAANLSAAEWLDNKFLRCDACIEDYPIGGKDDYVEPEPTLELHEVRDLVTNIQSVLAEGRTAYADDLLDELQTRINSVIGAP